MRIGFSALSTAFLMFFPVIGADAAVMTSETMNGVPVTVWKTSSKAAAYNDMPVIIFSHGFGGCSTQTTFLTEALADRGYLVVAPNHKDSRCGRKNEDEKSRSLLIRVIKHLSVGDDDDIFPPHLIPEKPFQSPDEWDETTERDRYDDIENILDFILSDKKYKAMINSDTIGIMGHSLGGYTAMAMAGAWPSWKDDRFRAVAAFAPYAAPFVRKKTLPDVKIPVMLQSGTKDKFTAAFLGVPGGAYDMMNIQKYHAILNGADHFAWTDSKPEFRNAIISYTLAFFDHYLRGNNTPLLFNRHASGLSEYNSNMIRKDRPAAKKSNSSSGK